MSGGSFDYLCYADRYNIGEKLRQVAEMEEALREYPAGEWAADATQHIITTMEGVERQMEALQTVWHNVEWHHSCDSDEESVNKALNEYNRLQSIARGERP